MRQLYLVKHIFSEPDETCLAEIYVDQEIKLNKSIIISLDRIITVLENLKIKDERIDNLRKIGENTYCIVDENYIDPITGRQLSYQIIKKINLYEHVYEIRFTSLVSKQLRHCRIFFTFNSKKDYALWTHGFTKIRDVSNYYGHTANEMTNLFGGIAEIIYKNINNSSDRRYICKEGEEHEVR